MMILFKKISWLGVMSLLSLPVYSGNEFWQWQENHAEDIANSVQELNAPDEKFISQMPESWEVVKTKITPFEPIDFALPYPSKKSIEIEFTQESNSQEIIVLEPSFLDTKHFLNERIELKFYQHDLVIRDSANWKIENEVNDQLSVQNVWKRFSQNSNEKLIEQFKIYKEALHLNDWDYAYLIFEYSKLFNSEKNKQNLMTHFLLVQSGYNASIAFRENDLILLMNTKSDILNTQYILDSQKKKWYQLEFKVEAQDAVESELTWLNLKHKNSKELFNIRLNPNINLGGKWQNKRFNYQVGSKQYEIYIPFQANIVLHYNKYPLVGVSDYINNDVHQQILDAIASQIEENIEALNEIEKINFLLNLTQSLTVLPLKDSDSSPKSIQQSVFSGVGQTYERVLLFKALVERFSGNYMMIVEYERHLSVGVKITSAHKLKTFRVNLNDYVFADPSYKFSKLGEKMPLENNPFYKWHPIY